MTSRPEHLKRCKERVLVYVALADVANAFASMASDLSRRPETEHHIGRQLGMRHE